MMDRLNLPTYKYRLQQTSHGLNIYDELRKKFVALTPEEWVRQHFVAYLIGHKGFASSLMANEIALTLNGTRRRCDTVAFDRQGHPLVIVEYKASNVIVSQAVFDQIVRYNMVLQAKYLIVSNGMTHYCCRIDYDNHKYEFIPDIPRWEDL